MVLSDDEISIIRGASVFEEEKEDYQIPPFMFKHDKVYFPKVANGTILRF